MRTWAGTAHVQSSHGRAAVSGTWPILLCVCIAKAAGYAGGSVRQAQMGRALVRVTARAPGPMWQATERERGSMWMG